MKHTIEKLKFVRQALVLAKSITVSRLDSEKNSIIKRMDLQFEVNEIDIEIGAVSKTISILESIGNDAEKIADTFEYKSNIPF